MEGVSIQWERTDILPSSRMKSHIFKSMRRSVSDLSHTQRKQKEKAESDDEQHRSAGNQVSVVSVQYDVPKVQTSTGFFRFRKMHTPVSSQGTVHRTKSEDKINHHSYVTSVPEYPLKLSARLERRVREQKEERKQQQESDQISNNIDAHRLKGLGVGKCYMEYKAPTTAPDGYRPSQPPDGYVPRPSQTPATTPGLMCYTPSSTNPSAPPSQQPSRLEYANTKSANLRNNLDSPLRNTQSYLQRAKTFMQEDKILSYKSQSQSQSHHTFHPSPLVHSQTPHGHEEGQSSRPQGRINQGFRGMSRHTPQESEPYPRLDEKDGNIMGDKNLVYRGYSFHERENGHKSRESIHHQNNIQEREGSYKSASGQDSGKVGREGSYKSVKHVDGAMEREPSHRGSRHHGGRREEGGGVESDGERRENGHHHGDDHFQYNK